MIGLRSRQRDSAPDRLKRLVQKPPPGYCADTVESEMQHVLVKAPVWPASRRLGHGFTLIELLVVIAVIGVLAALLLPALARSKQAAQKAACGNRLRQLGLASRLYTDDHQGIFPARTAIVRWPQQLKPGYTDTRVLWCPAERPPPGSTLGVTNTISPADLAPRTTLMNGFMDFLADSATPEELTGYRKGLLLARVKETAIPHPTATMLFGEKTVEASAFYVDLSRTDTDYLDALAEYRHGGTSGNRKAGGANTAMVDGSVQFLKYGKAICPLNLWAVTDDNRASMGLCRP